jgi:hypothetical protein
MCDSNWQTERQAVVSIYAVNLDKSDAGRYGAVSVCTGV